MRKLSIDFQRKVFDTYWNDHKATVNTGKYEYTIAYNPIASIHTWIIRKGRDGKWEWLHPLDRSISYFGKIKVG